MRRIIRQFKYHDAQQHGMGDLVVGTALQFSETHHQQPGGQISALDATAWK
ncbi:MAG: hypothetical protein R3D03_07750 [Geminicoccaceae bacterium]